MREFLEQHKFLLEGEKNKYWKIEKNKIQYFIKTGKSYKITDPEEIVRAEFLMELIEKYQYEAKDIDFEREMPQRVPNFYADIVVNKKGSDEPFLVIECKRVDITDAEFEQAVKQGAGNARVLASEYFGTVAGESRRFFLTKNFSEKNPLEKAESDCPVKYDKPEEWRFKKGHELWELGTIDQEGLKSILEKCHQTIWQGGKRNPGEAFSEVAKVIFVKVFDEKTLTKPGKFYQFQRKSGESTANVKKRIDEIYNEAKKRDPEVFSEDIRLDAQEITTVVEHLQKISLHKTDLDVKGEAFQKFMGNFFKGDFGQYFTPPPTVQFCLDLFKHEITDASMVIDPACGSGGFLLKALDTLRKQADEYFSDKKSIEHFRYWHDFAEYKLFGCEISESIARVAKMNMILHDDGHTNVIAHDTLELEVLDEIRIFNEDTKKWESRVNTTPNFQKGFKHDNFDFIFTNPPFGAIIRGSEKPYLEDYELASKVNSAGKRKKMKNQKTEILFIERCWQFLKEGGKMAVVLPDGILTNSSLQYVRDWILDHFKLLGVVSLPQDAFRYYGAGVKSSILILEKGKFSEDYPIFMAQPEQIGIDSTGRPCKNDLDEVVENFWEFQKDPTGFQKKKSKNLEWIFAINKESFEGRFDYYFYQPHFTKLEKQIKKISDKTLSDYIIDISSGATPNSANAEYYSDKENGVPFLRVQNLSPQGLKESNAKYISKEVHEKMLKRSQSAGGDLLVKITGVGRMAISSVVPENFECNINQHIVCIKTKDRKTSELLATFLNSDIGGKLASRRVTGGTRPALDYTALKSIPVVINDEISEKMDKAFAVKKEKEQEAKEILESIEPYLLGELGIEKVEEEEKEMIFCISRDDLRTKNRVDPYYWNPDFTKYLKAISKGKFLSSDLKNFIDGDLQKGILPTANKKDGKNKVLQIGNITTEGGFDFSKSLTAKEDVYSSQHKVKKGEIIFVVTGATIGKIAVWNSDEEIYLGGDLYKCLLKNYDPIFLQTFLFSIFGQKQILQNITGATNLHLSKGDIEKIQIPNISLKIQQKISGEISVRREKAKQLRKEAVEILEEAKMEVESVILGK